MTRTDLLRQLTAAGLPYLMLGSFESGKLIERAAVSVRENDIRTPAQKKLITKLLKELPWPVGDVSDKGVVFKV